MEKYAEAAPNDIENQYVDPLEILMKQKLDRLTPLSDSCCIYRVPARQTSVYPHVYLPKVVSIGPFHHGEQSLQAMEQHKYRYLQDFLVRTKESLGYYLKKVREQEAKLRSCYADIIEFSSDEFVSIILVDSAFIIELLLKRYFNDASDKDHILGLASLMIDLEPDMLMLENQLPIFILEDFFEPVKVTPRYIRNSLESERLSITKLYKNFFRMALDLVGANVNLERSSDSSETKGKHFLDILRSSCLPVERRAGGARDSSVVISVTKLHQSGVKLKVAATKNLFGIKFNNGILEIPKLKISHGMEAILRNLAAFEQCHHKSYMITDYLDILVNFVNTPRDVELLIEYGIFEDVIGDNSEACSMINRLSTGLAGNWDDFYFATLGKDLSKHRTTPLNKWKATLRQNYLNTPWAITSIVAAAFLIILTLIQTVCSLISLN